MEKVTGPFKNGVIFGMFLERIGFNFSGYTPGASNIAGNGKWGTRIEDLFPIKNGDIPASYVSLPEGIPIATETDDESGRYTG